MFTGRAAQPARWQGDDVATAWVVRAGRNGERDAWALGNGCSGGGWQEMPDLQPLSSREAVGEVVAATYAEPARANYTGQLWALRGRIQPGDLMVMPLKSTQQIALGRVTGGYEYRDGESDPNKRHVVPVEWLCTDLPRTAVKQDLLFTLGSAMSIFAPSKHHAVARLEQLLKDGTDPGQLAFLPTTETLQPGSDDVDEPEDLPDVIDIAATRVATRIQEEFAGHDLATLVGDLLTAEGFHCTVSPPGADGGIDVIAGRGPLGLEAPRLIVQVKSGGTVDSPVVNQLNGVLGTNDGLLVAWGGLTKPARDTLRGHRFRIALWEARDVIEAVQRNYDRLPDTTRAKLRLRQVWVTAD